MLQKLLKYGYKSHLNFFKFKNIEIIECFWLFRTY